MQFSGQSIVRGSFYRHFFCRQAPSQKIFCGLTTVTGIITHIHKYSSGITPRVKRFFPNSGNFTPPRAVSAFAFGHATQECMNISKNFLASTRLQKNFSIFTKIFTLIEEKAKISIKNHWGIEFLNSTFSEKRVFRTLGGFDHPKVYGR